MKKRNNILTFVVIFAIMVLMAMSDNVKGVFIPTFKTDFEVNNTQMGILLSICSLGYIISTYIGGILCEKIGQKKVMTIGFIFNIISLIGIYMSKTYIVLLVGLFFSNVGIALLGIGINTLVPMLTIGYQAIIMNLIHFSYGVGSTITQRTAGFMLYNGVSWRIIYAMIAILFFVVLIVFYFVKIPKSAQIKEYGKIQNKEIFKNKLLYYYMIALGLYVAAEIGTQSWFINFMRESYAFNENKSAYYSALFFGIFTIGRLLGGFVVQRFNYIKSVFISLLISFGLFTIGLLMGENGLIIISISGLFFGIVFPTMILTVSKVFEKNSAYITGVIITAASTINMIMSLMIGWLNDAIGVRITFFIIPICLLISAIFIYLIFKNTKNIKMTS